MSRFNSFVILLDITFFLFILVMYFFDGIPRGTNIDTRHVHYSHNAYIIHLVSCLSCFFHPYLWNSFFLVFFWCSLLWKSISIILFFLRKEKGLSNGMYFILSKIFLLVCNILHHHVKFEVLKFVTSFKWFKVVWKGGIEKPDECIKWKL